MTETERLSAEFDCEMRRILEKEVSENFPFRSIRFRAMVETHGGLETAHRLLNQHNLPENTFTLLRTIGCLDMTLEFYVVIEKYHDLFSDDERAIANWRLRYGD